MNENLVLEAVKYRFGEFILHSDQKILLFKDEIIPLNQKSYECLLLLVENTGKIVSKEDFKNKIWGGRFIEDRILAVNISGLRKILGGKQDGFNFIQTISGRGYKFLAEVEHIISSGEKIAEPDLSTENVNDTAIPKTPALSHKLIKTRSLAVIGSLFIIFCIGAAVFYYSGKKYEVKREAPKKIAIFPFENITHIKDTDYLSLAFADSINSSLTTFPNLSVTSTTQVKQYLNKSYEPIEEGRKLGASTIVTGSYQKSADKLLLNVIITDVLVPNPIIQQQQFIKTTNDLTNLQTNVVRFIIDSLNIKVPEKDLEALKMQESQNLEAYEFYLRGVNAHNNTKFDDAVLYYKKSVELDPDFDIAAESLAAVYLAQGNVFGCGEPCADKAAEILNRLHVKNPDNDRVTINLAQILIELNQAEKGIPMLKEIVKKDPKNYFAYNCLSYAYRHVGLLDESNFAYDKAVVDNQYTVLTDKAFWFANDARLYQEKYAEYIAGIDQHENRAANYNRGMAYFYLKDYQKAKSLFAEAYQRMPDVLLFKYGKAYIYFIDNDKPEGLNFLNDIYTSIKVNQMYSGDMIYKAAQAYAVYNQKEKALELFELSVEKGFICYPYFANDPLLENIRQEPGFQITLEKARNKYEAIKQAMVN